MQKFILEDKRGTFTFGIYSKKELAEKVGEKFFRDKTYFRVRTAIEIDDEYAEGIISGKYKLEY